MSDNINYVRFKPKPRLQYVIDTYIVMYSLVPIWYHADYLLASYPPPVGCYSEGFRYIYRSPQVTPPPSKESL